MKRIAGLLAGAVLAPACWNACAQTPDLRMDTGFYVGAGLGRSETRDLCHTVGGACDSKDVAWNLFAGYRFHRNVAVELGYSDFGDASVSGFVGGVASTLRIKTKAVELVAVGILPLGDRFSLYGKLGGFRYDSDGSARGGIVNDSSDKGTELTFGLGAEYSPYGPLGLRVEWQRYYDVGSGVIGLAKSDISVVRAAARYKF